MSELQIDVSDSDYASLSRSAGGIAKLLDEPKVRADPNLAGSRDDFLGAIYALIVAKQLNFEDRQNRPIEIATVLKRAGEVGEGKVRTDGKWMARFYFNSALFRIAAMYHRVHKRDHASVRRRLLTLCHGITDGENC